MKKHWPAIGVALGLGLAATGTALVAMGHIEASLGMGLALSGACLVLLSSVAWYVAYGKEESNINSPWRLRYELLLGIAISTIIMAGLGYGIIHWGTVAVSPATFSIETSLGIQAVIGFGIGAAVGFGLFSRLNTPAPLCPTPTAESMKKNWPSGVIMTIAPGFLLAGTTTLGPALSFYMGAAAANTAEALSMEIIMAVSIASMAFMSVILAIDSQNAYKAWQNKANQAI